MNTNTNVQYHGQRHRSKEKPLDKKITHPHIERLHKFAAKLRSEFARFYGDMSRERVRFTFGDSPSAYFFKIRFTPSHRTLRFAVPKEINTEIDADDVIVHLLEKTDNIVRDIDSIYLVRDTQAAILDIMSDDDMEKFMTMLWKWGISGYRKNDVFRASSVWYHPDIEINDTTLAIGLITDVKEKMSRLRMVDGVVQQDTILELTLQNNEKAIVNVDDDVVSTIYPGLIFMQNKYGSFNIMRFKAAKHHINFTESQYNTISDFLANEVDHERKAA